MSSFPEPTTYAVNGLLGWPIEHFVGRNMRFTNACEELPLDLSMRVPNLSVREHIVNFDVEQINITPKFVKTIWCYENCEFVQLLRQRNPCRNWDSHTGTCRFRYYIRVASTLFVSNILTALNFLKSENRQEHVESSFFFTKTVCKLYSYIECTIPAWSI